MQHGNFGGMRSAPLQQTDGASRRGAPIPSVRWLDDCARRLCELDASMTQYDADQVAVRLWHRNGASGGSHPVAAAESWHDQECHGVSPEGVADFDDPPALRKGPRLRI